jgi:acetyltransferase
MFDWARALAWCPPPAGRSVAVLTNAGGPGVTASDALEANGMHLAELSEATRLALGTALPPAASLYNPVDMLASASPEQYALCLRILLDDPGVHAVMAILPPPPMFTAGAVAKAVIPVIHSAEKPVVFALMGERLIQEAVEHLRAARVPEYRFPERAASALAVLARRAEYLASATQPLQACCEGARELARDILTEHRASQPQPEAFLPVEILERILAAYGIRTPAGRLAETAEQAAETARQIGFPVALKIASADILHKSDAHGVLLNLRDQAAVLLGFNQIIENARRIEPPVQIAGVHVQGMAGAGQDVIIGAVQDQHFGPLVMFGSGGTEVEGLKDVAFALAPITQEEAEYLLESTWAGRKLQGFRNLPPADRPSVLDALSRMAQLAADFPELAEIEINPLRVLGAGQGAIALDARARLIS